eukprot:TRINITY_DN9938_c0_g2_i1.p1 TRINITY_DN9938_c0_g2~~TRINITY_DN9938_c0_g2_i1.p1  ORF type:complete len:344 (-),score=57.41 TRINITY_DN9938_c0_g2_i1:142-1131(-)
MSGEGVAESECAICFELGYSTVLPCACKVSYCTRCWDQSLAASFHSCGQARCPTCRGPVHVDFDASSGRMVFSREEASDDDDDDDDDDDLPPVTDIDDLDEAAKAAVHAARAIALARKRENKRAEQRQEITHRLLHQARPAQIEILRKLGNQQPEPRLIEVSKDPESVLYKLSKEDLESRLTMLGSSAEDCTDREELARRLRDLLGSSTELACHLAAPQMTCKPPCVCGSTLHRVSGVDRMLSAIPTIMPHASKQERERLFVLMLRGDIPGVQCDLCDRVVRASNGIWTCENGTSTILHATAYDVCDSCLAVHAYGLECPPATAAPATG